MTQEDGPEIKLHETLMTLINEGGFSGTRKQICSAVGISASALSQFARGQARPSLETLVRLAQFFDVSLDYLVFGVHERRQAPAADHGPLARYIDVTLANLQNKSDERTALVARIARALAEQIDSTAERLAAKNGSHAGLLADEETMVLEGYSVQTWILSMNLQYDIIQPEGEDQTGENAEAAAGRFLPIVVSNLSRGGRYRFLLPAALRDWRSVVRSYRTILTRECTNSRLVVNNCGFRTTSSPLIAGCGLYQLDLPRMSRENPVLLEQIRHVIRDGWIGYVIPPSQELRADALLDAGHLENARRTFADMWRRGQRI
jgi:transcriptional regulator with XRE-family HTH domain